MRLVPVGVDPDLFRPLPTGPRPGRLITTASADVALKGLGYLIEAVAKLRTERDVSLTIIGRPKTGQEHGPHRALGLGDYVEFVSGVPDERIVELYAEAELAVVPSLYEGSACRRSRRWPPARRSWRPTEGRCPRSPAPTARRCCGARRRCRRARRAIRRGLDDAELRPVSVRPAGDESSSGGRGDAAPSSPSSSTARCWRCPRTSPSCRRTADLMLTVRFDKLTDSGCRRRPRPRRRGRLRPPRLRVARRGLRVVALDYAADELVRHARHTLAAMSDAGEIEDKHVVGVAAWRRHRPCRSPTVLRRRRHLGGARTHPGRRRRRSPSCARVLAPGGPRRHGAAWLPEKDQLDAVGRVPRPSASAGTCASTRPPSSRPSCGRPASTWPAATMPTRCTRRIGG